jgi:hypothetical protein
MTTFIALRDASPESIRSYKREIRAIVVDRAAYHLERLLDGIASPSPKRYQTALQESLAKAKLDVMAEVFQHMQELSRPRGVAGWTRGRGGLVRRARDPDQVLALVAAYSDVVRYLVRLRAQGTRRRS